MGRDGVIRLQEKKVTLENCCSGYSLCYEHKHTHIYLFLHLFNPVYEATAPEIWEESRSKQHIKEGIPRCVSQSTYTPTPYSGHSQTVLPSVSLVHLQQNCHQILMRFTADTVSVGAHHQKHFFFSDKKHVICELP